MDLFNNNYVAITNNIDLYDKEISEVFSDTGEDKMIYWFEADAIPPMLKSHESYVEKEKKKDKEKKPDEYENSEWIRIYNKYAKLHNSYIDLYENFTAVQPELRDIYAGFRERARQEGITIGNKFPIIDDEDIPMPHVGSRGEETLMVFWNELFDNFDILVKIERIVWKPLREIVERDFRDSRYEQFRDDLNRIGIDPNVMV